MSTFNKYSDYYDLIYADKDYKKEVKFIVDLIEKYKDKTKTILDLGCGTGLHAFLLSKEGYDLSGVDLSEKMLQKARELNSEKVDFHKADIRDFSLVKKFDTIISLFHVVSYLNTLKDFEKTLKSVKKHLNPEGIFIFDSWYGPAVLSNPPSVRVKEMEDERAKITRISEPTHHIKDQLIDVDYTLFVEDKTNKAIDKFSEKHTMRYYFQNEIEHILGSNDFEVIECKEWFSKKSPDNETFSVYWVIKNK